MALTKINPLHDPNFDFVNLHFYMPFGKRGVYEFHANTETKTHSGSEVNPDLESKAFSQEGFMEKFREESEDVEGNAYVITNPSEIIPAESLAFQGLRHHITSQREYFAKVEGAERAEAKENPVPYLVRGMKRMREFLGRERE